MWLVPCNKKFLTSHDVIPSEAEESFNDLIFNALHN